MSPDDRRQYLISLCTECGKRYFNAKTRVCLIPRDTLWFATGLVLNGSKTDQDLGMSLIEESRNEDNSHTPATMIVVLHALRDILSEKANVHLRSEIQRSLVRAALVEWHDGNVNHPLGAWCTLTCGGELSDERWAVELGYQRLKRFRSIIGDRRHSNLRQAEMSEYNSLTYSALDIIFLAIIAEYVVNQETKHLALFLEQRLWLNMAMQFHAPSGQFAGPHSRSYIDDSHGGYSAMHALWYRIFDNVRLDPEIPKTYNHPSNLLQNAITAITPLHIPEPAVEMAWKKPFPYSFRKRTYGESYHENHSEKYFDSEVYPGGWSELVTYMTPEYALGTASLPYVNAAQSDSVILRIKNKIGHRSMFTRAVFNDSVAGQKNRCHVTKGQIDESYLYEEGRVFTAQHNGKAIVCYHPKRAGHTGIRSFRVDIICTFDKSFEQLHIGDIETTHYPQEFHSLVPIFFQDYQTFCAIVPLMLSPLSNPAMKVWLSNGYLIISLINYDGKEKNCTRDELTAWRNGFIIKVAESREYTSFDKFKAYIETTRIDDLWQDRVRTLKYHDQDNTLALSYDPFAERILLSTVDENECKYDGMFVECEGLNSFRPQTLFGSEAL